MKAFLDKTKPLHTCCEADCSNCKSKTELYCHFDGKKLLRFLIIALTAFFIGGFGIVRFNYLFLFPWIAAFLLYFGLFEIRAMCSHCPHYAEPGTKILQCWANYGSPKLWKYRPGPMTVWEKVVFFAGIAVVFCYPAAIMVISGQFILLAGFVLYIILGGYIVKRTMCEKCMNFACPFNCVKQETRDEFMQHNPVIRDAWKKKPSEKSENRD